MYSGSLLFTKALGKHYKSWQDLSAYDKIEAVWSTSRLIKRSNTYVSGLIGRGNIRTMVRFITGHSQMKNTYAQNRHNNWGASVQKMLLERTEIFGQRKIPKSMELILH